MKGHVNRVAKVSPTQGIKHLIDDLGGHISLSLVGAGAQVRAVQHMRVTYQRIVIARRFLAINVDGRGADFAIIQGCCQRFLVDQLAASTIDDDHTIFHLSQRLLIDYMFCFR